MTKTTQELVYRAASEMGRHRSGDSFDAGDYQTIEDLIEPLIEQLGAEEIAYVDDIDAIEPAVFLPIARLVAVEAAPSFGSDAIQSLLTNTRASNVDALREREHETLRKIFAPRRSRPTLQIETGLRPVRRTGRYSGDA
jgi:hypothetical protein